jgi:ribosome biogenesis GTPase
MDAVVPPPGLGWDDGWAAAWAALAPPGTVPGRVVRADRGLLLVATAARTVHARPSPGLLRAARGAADLRAVGDWVAVTDDPAADAQRVEAVLPRRGAVTRGGPGAGSDVQVLAANVDVVFVVHPIDAPPKPRRVERELALAWDAGAVPVVVLTKADLSPDPAGALAEVGAVAPGVDLVAVDARDPDGVRALRDHLGGRRTAVLIGPSGAGKSTLANALAGAARQATGAVRVTDGRGRHTTVTRELFPLEGGGVLIDTPGLRAVGMTGSDEGIGAVFEDVEALAEGCRFRDCTHRTEPGCAVLAAVDSGELAPDRLDAYRSLLREAAAAASRTDERLRGESQRRAKEVSRAVKGYYRLHGRGPRDR